MTGTIKTTVSSRGFGFIADPTGDDYFFHHTDLAEGTQFADLAEGDEVSFQPVEPTPPKGKRASQVQRVATAAPEAA